MEEYIERGAFIEVVKDIPMWGSVAVMLADSIPAANVAPVVHGRWIYDKKAQRPYCSVCKGYFYGATNSPMSYCPNCGTKMDGSKA